MDISNIVNWGTIAIWVFGIIAFAAKLLRGEKQMPPKLRQFLNSNWLIGLVLVGGLIGSVFQTYLRVTESRLNTTLLKKNSDLVDAKSQLTNKNSGLEKENSELSSKLATALMLPPPSQPITAEQEQQLVLRLMSLYGKQHPSGTGEERLAWVNSEIKHYGYTFQITYVKGEPPVRKNFGGFPTATKDNPCPLGHVEIDNPYNHNVTNGLVVEGRTPCVIEKGAIN